MDSSMNFSPTPTQFLSFSLFPFPLFFPFLFPAQRMGRTMQVPCDTEYPAFVSERTIKENTGNIDCDGCIKYETHKQTSELVLEQYRSNSNSNLNIYKITWISAGHCAQ